MSESRMKRKGFDEVAGDPCFISPAKRIRMPEAEFPSTMEEEVLIPLVYQQQSYEANVDSQRLDMENTEMISALHLSEERAIVLYKAVDEPQTLTSPSSWPNVSLKISPDLIAALKNQAPWQDSRNPFLAIGVPIDDKSTSTNDCRSLVPCVLSQNPMVEPAIDLSESRKRPLEEQQEPMEAEESEDASMEVDEMSEQRAFVGWGGEHSQQWQQHCMGTQLQATSVPTMSSW